ncbi:septum formation family protein [Curtobacterium sp. MCSS17_007]|uniref:septum formation family protein n=1 Tax=Curtobacterium sp. MCSS17_007 TaxID=2175646 RepID=UPI000DA95589|nr:septum formation family protein [Curtobacterium sp. MCSS17_007]WIE76111.1 septum formation family protein [Curtobacterium sp. MCSS17_007]
MTGERPDDAREPEGTAGPADGTDGPEAQRASAPDAPFRGLRSAADIFGAPRAADEWPSRRERREAERAARETGAPLPEPFEPDSAGAGPTDAPAAGSSPAFPAPTAPDPDDAGATQAIRMDDELREPSENPRAVVEHERETLGERIPPAAPVPPTSTVSHPSSISLPTAMQHREQRAAENRAVDDERRRLDPFGQGRSDVDWLGRATGTPAPEPTPTGPVAQPIGVGNVLPPTPAVSTDEPPSFTELLRLQGAEDATRTGATERPFDWAIRDDETGEVPTTLTTDRFDTTALGAGSWSLADEADDDVVTGEVDTPAGGLPAGLLAAPAPVPAPAAAPGTAQDAPTTAPPAATEQDAPTAQDAPREQDAPTAQDAPTTALPAVAHDGSGVEDPTAGHDDEDAPGTETSAPGAAAATPWWAEPVATVPPTAAPPLVEPDPQTDTTAYPAHLPPSVGQDLGGLAAARRGHDEREQPGGPGAQDADDARPAERLPAAAPEDLDQSEWDGRETSDTGVIKDLFGTAAVGQLGDSGYDPDDSGTRMMPAVGATGAPGSTAPTDSAGAPARAAAAPGPDGARGVAGDVAGKDSERDNFINEGFGRLAGEGKRGKQLLVVGAVVLIVVLLLAVFGLTRWILGGSISEETAPASSASATSAASGDASPSTAPSTEAAAPAAPAQPLQFATTPAAPGQHAWTDLAGGECLSPFDDAWAQTFTVVACSAPHAAQLTARVQVEAGAWPGPDDLRAQAAEVCQTSQAIDTAAAASYGDVQVQGSYAPDQETWDRGNTFISCFATRSSGQPLTGSLAPDGA